MLEDIPTPALLLDRPRFDRNADRLKQRLSGLGVGLRPHMKTAKSADILRVLAPEAITVSTLKEAESFAEAGARDILYAVGLAPAKLSRVKALRARGVDLSVVVDNEAAARAIAAAPVADGRPIPVLIEIDTDGHRAGVQPRDEAALLEIGRILSSGGATLRGVMTHAGGSYGAAGEASHAAAAEDERAGAVAAAETLRRAGLPCPVVSVGSTPTAHAARSLAGVTEVRAGVYMFGDLVMAGLGVLAVEDIALSVLATVIGHQRDKGWIIVDAGWMALSRDRGTGSHEVDQGYGLVCSADGVPFPDLIVVDANQEHGIIALRPGSPAGLPTLLVGDQVRILPIHACATAAQHDRYQVLGTTGAVEAVWPRFSGW
ncbi:MAG TPA: alanine racemase [Allosphingosinicella sp.]|jgi:D-serine deaminase-like pyridoxal phosphate-dependent protein